MSATSLKKQAVNGTIWTIVGYGSGQVIRFGGNLILTRLLVPELFGLMALVQVFIQGLNLFSDVGIRPSIIRSDRGEDPVFLNTAWTIQVIRGFGLWICCLIFAYPVANYYNDSRLTWLIPIVGLNTIIAGFDSTSIPILNRRMEIKKLAIFELVIRVVSLGVLIVWAWFSPTIWALVGGNLISILLKAFWSHRLNTGKPNRFAWNKDVIAEITSFGKWIFVSTAMTFLASQADRLLLGKYLDLKVLGIYVVALTFADVPRQVSLKIGSQVIFPAISQLIDLPRKTLNAKIINKRWKLLMLLAAIVISLLCFGDLVILWLYDERYQEAAWMLPILALGLWPLLLCTTIDRSLMAIGKPSYLAFGNLLKFAYMVTGVLLGYAKMGVLGAIIVIAFNDLPYYVAVHYGMWRERLNFIWQDLQATIVLMGVTVLITVVRFAIGFGTPIDGILLSN